MALISEEIAGWATAVLVGIASAWKFVIRGRRDIRDDRGEGDAARAYRTIVDNLEDEVRRLDGVVSRLSNKLDDEMELRRSISEENSMLRGRVAHLESEIRRLGGNI